MKRTFVAGHRGMVGSALVRKLKSVRDVEVIVRPRSALDLLDQSAVSSFFKELEIDEVYLAAAKVGGIQANNSFPADFISENLMIECNVIRAAHASNVQKLLFLGSSCIYPKSAEQPMTEEALLTGPLEPTNEPYSIAKIAGIKLCESYNRQHGRDYRSVMPTNLYGPGDNFHPENSHVVAALLRRFHEAHSGGESEVVVWGTGTPRREILHVDDMADACVFVMGLERTTIESVTSPMTSHINVGTGEDCSIKELAELIAEITGFQGRIAWDTEKPDGTARKLLDVLRLTELGWSSSITPTEGLRETYDWFVKNQSSFRD